MGMKWKEENREKIPVMRSRGKVEYLVFPGLEKTGAVDHLFSTRLGGVSRAHLGTMNLSFTRGDKEEYVRENYRRIAETINCEIGDFVFSHQTHTANVRIITGKDRGKGLTEPLDYKDVDGLVTCESGIVLSAFFADCVPLFFVDPVNKVIGLSHSGWRGTIGRIGEKTIERMEELGAMRECIRAAIGPSICRDCYEVGEDVASIFKQEFSEHQEEILKDKGEDKYLLNLWKANELILLEAGIRMENLETTNLCTCCNPELLFSHRASQGMRGNLGAFLRLKKS
ncbi:MAG: peptidoglycan editing factor PgeF [Lachnospiraceae bacterium]